jgi:type IV pilus assembly protein PilM
MKSNRILALDIGSSTIKLAEFHVLKNGSLELSAYACGNLGMDPHADTSRSQYMVATIHELMSDAQIKPGPVLISVTGQSVFSRYVKLPESDPGRVAEFVEYEAKQHIPHFEEVNWDYQLLESAPVEDEEAGEQSALIVAIKHEILDEITDAVLEAGLAASIVDVSPMAIFNAVQHNYGELEGCTLVMDMGARSTSLIFIEAGRVFSRSIPVAGNAITQTIMKDYEVDHEQAEELKFEHAMVAFGGAYEPLEDDDKEKISKAVRSVMTRMHTDINRSINVYRAQQGGTAPVRVLLTGGSSIIPHVDTFINEKLGVEVEYLNPFQQVYVGDAIDAEAIAGDAHMMSEVVGLALRVGGDCAVQLDLIPQKFKDEKEFQKKVPMLIASMALLVLTLVVWGLFLMSKGSGVRKELEAKESEVSGLNRYATQIGAAENKGTELEGVLSELKTAVAERRTFVDVLGAIRSQMPAGAWLTQVETDLPSIPKSTSKTASDTPVAPDVIQFQGIFYRDAVKPDQIKRELIEKLSAMDIFSEASIVKIPTDDRPNLQSYWIKVTLKDKLPR